uniref:Uncharacterized protein n=1 Tax=Arcella intermedia TaxID=1963864 RepID=A0A6B2LC90_9EUKA
MDRILSNMGFCTRSKVRSFIDKNHVLVNNQKMKASEYVFPEDITINGTPISFPYPLYIVLHKPRGYVCSAKREQKDGKIVYDLLPETWIQRRPSLACAGRLDKWASGLVVMTQDGDCNFNITSPKKKSGVLGKVYELELQNPLTGDEPKLFSSGQLQLKSEQKPCRPAKFEIIDKEAKLVRITLYEGKYHQLRRMLAATGNRAVSIKRVATGPLLLGGLPVGHWRELSREEVLSLGVESDRRPYLESDKGKGTGGVDVDEAAIGVGELFAEEEEDENEDAEEPPFERDEEEEEPEL